MNACPRPWPCPLSEPLTQLLSQSVVTRHIAYDWHSATFSGQRWVIDVLTGADSQAIALFAQNISDQEFTLDGLLLADIVMTGQKPNPDGGVLLTVEALLLDDEL